MALTPKSLPTTFIIYFMTTSTSRYYRPKLRLRGPDHPVGWDNPAGTLGSMELHHSTRLDKEPDCPYLNGRCDEYGGKQIYYKNWYKWWKLMSNEWWCSDKDKEWGGVFSELFIPEDTHLSGSIDQIELDFVEWEATPKLLIKLGTLLGRRLLIKLQPFESELWSPF